MARATYVFRNGRMVDKRHAAPLNISTDPRVYVIGDVMAPAKHPGSGKVYDSKARFRADTRAMGFVEAGNDPAIRRDVGISGRVKVSQADVAHDVKRAIQELNSR